MRPWLLYLLVLCLPASCIEPPLHLASAEALDPDLAGKAPTVVDEGCAGCTAAAQEEPCGQ